MASSLLLLVVVRLGFIVGYIILAPIVGILSCRVFLWTFLQIGFITVVVNIRLFVYFVNQIDFLPRTEQAPEHVALLGCFRG